MPSGKKKKKRGSSFVFGVNGYLFFSCCILVVVSLLVVGDVYMIEECIQDMEKREREKGGKGRLWW
jgi:hypothetical protein